MDNIYNVYEKVKKNGYKITDQRKIILNVLFENKDFLLEPSELFERILKINRSINFSTVYRNLEIFLNIGVVKKVSLESGKSTYQIVFENEHSHSMICKNCGRVEMLKNCPFEKIDISVFKKNGFIPESHKFEIYGFCKQCLSKE